MAIKAIFVSVILGFSLAASTSISAVSTSASSSSTVSIRVSDIISMRLLDRTATDDLSELVLDITPTPVGAFSKNSLLAEVSTSNPSGYTLYLSSNGTNPVNDTSASPTYTNALVHTDPDVPTANGTIPSLPAGTSESPTSVTEAEFRVANSLYKTKWGYSVNALDVVQAAGTTPASVTDVTDTAAITYSDIPAHGVDKAIGTVSTASESYLIPVTIGVNASSAVTAGAYQNILEFTATANAIPTEYTVNFDANTEDTTSPIPSSIVSPSLASSVTITLPDTIPTKSGMVLREWNTAADGSGIAYQPGGSIEIISDDSDPFSTTKTLYAIWTNDFWNIAYMQDMYPTVCASLYTPSNVLGSSANAIVLRSDGISSVSGAGSTSIVDDTAGYKAIVTADNMPYVAQRTLYDIRDSKTYTVRKLADGNCWMTSNLALVLTANTKSIGSKNDGTTFEWTPTSCSSYGECPMNGNTRVYNSNYFYTWYAATAGVGNSTDGDGFDIDGSICPRGWRMPARSSLNPLKSYGALTDAYGMTENGGANHNDNVDKFEGFPLSFVRGVFNQSGSYSSNPGTGWSSSTLNEIGGRAASSALYFNSTETTPNSWGQRVWGEPVRCVAL